MISFVRQNTKKAVNLIILFSVLKSNIYQVILFTCTFLVKGKLIVNKKGKETTRDKYIFCVYHSNINYYKQLSQNSLLMNNKHI